MGKFRDERYGKTLDEKKAKLIKMAVESVKRARGYVNDVQFYAEDAGRADPAYLFEMLHAAIDAGATVVNIPDTTGYTIPEQFGNLIRSIREKVPNIDKATISVHCHDDLGLAVANSLAGIRNGARQVEGTINGIGERAGNAALEEIVMAMRTRGDYFGTTTGIDTREFCRTSRMTSDMMGIVVSPNKAVVGSNAFSHSSGIHVDGFLKDHNTYEIMRPEDVGMGDSRVVLTARTGRAGLRDRLVKLGYTLSKEELDRSYQRFLAVADKKLEVFDEDLVAIIHDELHPVPEICQLQYMHIYTGTSSHPHGDRAPEGEGRSATGRGHRRWPGGRRLQGHCGFDRHHRQADALRNPRRDQRHGGHGRSDRATGGRRKPGGGTRRFDRRDRSQRQGVRGRTEPAGVTAGRGATPQLCN